MMSTRSRIAFGVVAALTLALVTGCGSKTVGSGARTGSVVTNALTGLPGSNGPVLFVKVDDTKPAHPQVGLSSASVIYIEQVEGGLTRLAAVFTDQLPQKVGPVRSARISDIDLMAQYGHAALAFSGAQTLFLPVLDAANIEDIGADHEPASIYSRDPARVAPTNMLLDPTALLRKSIEVEHRTIATAQSIGWNFGALPDGGASITSVSLKWPAASYSAKWSPSESRWLLSFDGAPDLDSDGNRLGSPTVIIQNVSITNSIYHDHLGDYTPFSNTVGSGTGYLLRDGREFPILWSRPTPTSPTTWTLTNGHPALLHPGQVWVALTDQPPRFTQVATSPNAQATTATK